MSHYKSLAAIMERCVGMTLRDVDAFLVVYHTNNPHLAIMYQAAKNLDAEGLDTAASSEYDNVAGSQPARRQA